ncbi:sulfurtransferase [Ectothiorhodospiraceae bacterium WFHF3C12]|nr:sulfurtransferase [Ectothiorhodospiraceae bacterium WFHF3C12]
MAFHDLIDVDDLAARIDAPDWVVVDCRFDLADPAAGEARYREGRLPGARYAHLDRDLSAPPGPADGRHPLPAPAELAATLRGWGVSTDTQIVAYDDAGGAFAARLWWLCRWLGHDAVAVLDGGVQAWVDAELALTRDAPEPRAGDFTGNPRPALVATADELAREVPTEGILLLDARSPERFRGEAEPIDPVAGHVPGAVNRPHTANLDGDGRFAAAQDLREDYGGLLDGRSPHDVVVMCGSGVTACHDLLAMHRAGLTDARLFPGSWSEWIRDPVRPTDPPRH